MRKHLGHIIASAVALVILLAIAAAINRAEGTKVAPNLDAVTVLVEVSGGHGSGVVIAAPGARAGTGSALVLTAAHVVSPFAKASGDKSDTSKVTVVTHDGRRLEAVVEWIAVEADVALLRLIDARLPAAELSCALPAVGEAIEIVGSPLTLSWTHSYGRIGALDRDLGGNEGYLQLDAAIYFGNSGGPVFDAAGRVVGLAVAMAAIELGWGQAAPLGFAFAVPGARLCGLLAWV